MTAVLEREEARRERGVFPWPLIGLAGVALLLTAPGPQALQAALVVAMAVLLLMGTQRPVWGAAAVLVLELTMGNYMLPVAGGALSLRLIVTALAFALVLVHLIRRDSLPAGLLLPLAAAFVAVCAISAYLNTDLMQAFKALRFLLYGLMAMTAVALSVQDREDLRQLLLAGLTTAALSALAGILQHYSGTLGAPYPTTILSPGGGSPAQEWGGRSLGLAENPLHLSDDMLLALFVLIGVFVSVRVGLGQRWALALLGAALLLGLYFSYTRSSPLAAAAGLLVLLAYRGPYRRDVWLGALLLALVMVYVTDVRGNRYTVTEDASVEARPILWQASFWMALDHPYLGVGPGQFVELAPSYANAVDQELLRREAQRSSQSVLGVYTPHNDYLNVWVTYGLPAVALYVGLLGLAAYRLFGTYRRARDGLVAGAALGLLGALLSYVVNSAFHNFFDSALTFWLLLGAAVAMGDLVWREEARDAAGER